MKQVYVLRHGPKDKDGNLTTDGKTFVQNMQGKYGVFDRVISSEMSRAMETANILTGQEPKTDHRANVIPISPEEEEILFAKKDTHPLGIAGLVFETPQYRILAQKAGESLVTLIRDVMSTLPENGRGLIISHDSSIAAAERILRGLSLDKIEKNYRPLEGFMVNEHMHITEITS
jgi:broad specificity phosphatase PhoE